MYTDLLETLRRAKATRRRINFLKSAVWCPYHDKNVRVRTNCLEEPGHSGCDFFNGVRDLGSVMCSWTEEDGQAGGAKDVEKKEATETRRI